MQFLVTFRPNWWIIGAIFEEICIYVEELRGFGQPLIPFHLLIRELQEGPYMVLYWVCQNTALPFAPTVCTSIVIEPFTRNFARFLLPLQIFQEGLLRRLSWISDIMRIFFSLPTTQHSEAMKVIFLHLSVILSTMRGVYLFPACIIGHMKWERGLLSDGLPSERGGGLHIGGGGGGCPLRGVFPLKGRELCLLRGGASRQNPSPRPPRRYGQPAVGTHPTGMQSCIK